MFNSLSQFYNSAEWRSFRAVLIQQRTSPIDGILYSEYSQKPLLKSYDIVLHHKQPLTVQNVNNYDISLNPENILICSQQEHNEIHSRFGYAVQKKVFYVYGAPCSGKTTFVNSIKGNSDFIVDMDNIWQCITGGQRYEKPNALKTIAFNVRDSLLEMVKTRAGNFERAYIIDGGAIKGVRERKIDLYRAEPIFINTDKKECLKRLYNDTQRSDVQKKLWEKYINDWFNDYQE